MSFSCQLRHRLLGLDALAAASVCRMPYSSTAVNLFTDSSYLFHSTNTTNNKTASSSPVDFRVRRENPPSDSFVEDSLPEGNLHVASGGRPLMGPLLLNLFTYLMVNLVFASMCLLDASVKHRWLDLLRRWVSRGCCRIIPFFF